MSKDASIRHLLPILEYGFVQDIDTSGLVGMFLDVDAKEMRETESSSNDLTDEETRWSYSSEEAEEESKEEESEEEEEYADESEEEVYNRDSEDDYESEEEKWSYSDSGEESEEYTSSAWN